MLFLLVLIKVLVLPFVFLLSMYGLGSAATKIFRSSLSRWFYPALGVSVCLVASGFFVLADIADRAYLMTVVVIGILCGIGSIWQDRHLWSINCRSFFRERANVLWAAGIAAFLLPLWWSCLGGIHQFADKTGYLVHIVRLVEIGQYGPDPFNSRIAESSLGGQNLLMGMLHVMGLPLYQMRVLERFIAPLIILFTAWGCYKDIGMKQVTRQMIILPLLILFYFGVGLGESSTLTGTYTAIPYYFIILWIALTPRHWNGSGIIIQGVCLASAICLKGTHVPVLGLFVFMLMLRIAWENPKRAIAHASMLAVVLLVTLCPWMVNLYQSNHTFLYPFLGKGYHGSQFGVYFAPSFLKAIQTVSNIKALIHALDTLIPLGILGCTILWSNYLQRKKNTDLLTMKTPSEKADLSFVNSLIALMAFIIAGALLTIATGFTRYSFITDVALVFVITLWVPTMWWKHSKASLFMTGLITTLIFLVCSLQHEGVKRSAIEAAKGVIHKGQTNEIISPESVRTAQSSIPEGELILARMGQAYFLDFARNPIWHLDIPGASCLPPGLPIEGTPVDLIEYLRSIKVRYFIYSELDDGGHDIEEGGFVEKMNSPNLWERYFRNIVLFDDTMRHLSEHCKIHYRDNGLVVFDLQSPPDQPMVLRRTGQED